jgi:uncharacterized damage-inducible protein DinB
MVYLKSHGEEFMSETSRIADQLRRAFEGEAWHGPSILPLLHDLDARSAMRRPIENAHNIWEIVAHIEVWDRAVLRRIAGEVVQPTPKEDFPAIQDSSEQAWKKMIEKLVRTHHELVTAVAAFPESRLDEKVPGKEPAYHTFYFNLHGVVQHEIYHAGQIALLKKM